MPKIKVSCVARNRRHAKKLVAKVGGIVAYKLGNQHYAIVFQDFRGKIIVLRSGYDRYPHPFHWTQIEDGHLL